MSSESAPQSRPPRASWDDYFMAIARVVSSRSTCDRKFVGAVIVRNRTILSDQMAFLAANLPRGSRLHG